ncbi:alpha-N-acetylglucosaminidase [Caerostris extrusa]|uniref:Alpha-N-acetylglucosaminidase n=1 Tax=Caerostris extrusa TaxID=172846 RepID=A0AAV4TSF7_CAEEX|nr:alpha-N-acetylglucosaminidase [Caerostris extrusa]
MKRLCKDNLITWKRRWYFQKISYMSLFLQPTDPLFQEVGTEFLRTYIEEFGTDHIYSADLFNEMPPPSNDPSYLQSCSKALYKSL